MGRENYMNLREREILRKRERKKYRGRERKSFLAGKRGRENWENQEIAKKGSRDREADEDMGGWEIEMGGPRAWLALVLSEVLQPGPCLSPAWPALSWKPGVSGLPTGKAVLLCPQTHHCQWTAQILLLERP